MERQQKIRRDKVLSEMGLRVVRFRNEEVMKNLSAVVGNVRELVFEHKSKQDCDCSTVLF
jgi:very-short-patch-repair endonuclease